MWSCYGESTIITYVIKFQAAETSAINIYMKLKLDTAFLSTNKLIFDRPKHPIKYKNSFPTFLLIASRLTCEASGRQNVDPDVSEVCRLHLRWSSSPTWTAGPTQCHIPEDFPNFTYFVLEGSRLCFIYRPSKWNLGTTVNESVSLTECGPAHSAATVKCFLANCGVAQNGHPPTHWTCYQPTFAILWSETRP